MLSNKELIIMYHLIKVENHITAEQLSKYSSMSIRTVRTKINHLNQDLKSKEILEIESIHAKGYKIKIIDYQKYNQFEKNVISSSNFYRDIGKEKMIRRLYISQQLLSNEYIKLETLSGQLYMTISGLKKDMKWVRRFFYSYDINIKSKPSLGLYIIGKEENIRLLMVEAFCSQYYFIDYKLDNFNTMFYDDYDEYQRIRGSFLKIIRESLYTFRDIYSKKISTYLVLSRNRCKQGKYIKVSKQLKMELENTYELEIANKTFQMEGVFELEKIIVDEIYYLALYLILSRDYDFSNYNISESYNYRYINETILLLSRVDKKASVVFCPSIYQMELFTKYESKFISSLYKIYLTYLFDSNEKWILSSYYEVLDDIYSPIAIHYSRILLISLEKDLGIQIDKTKIYDFIMLFDLLLKKVNYPYKKRRLALISLASNLIGNEYKDIVKEKFSKYIEYIDVFSQYEMRGVDLNDYDICIIDCDINALNNHPIEFVYYPFLSLEESTIPLFKKVFFDGYSMDSINLMKNITNVYENFKCLNYQILFQIFSYKYAEGNKANQLEQSLLAYENKFSFYNSKYRTALLFLDYSLTRKKFIDVYQVDRKMHWNNNEEKKVEYIIAVSIPNNLKVTEIKTINKVLFSLSSNTDLCQQLFNNIKDTYQKIFGEIIIKHFIRE